MNYGLKALSAVSAVSSLFLVTLLLKYSTVLHVRKLYQLQNDPSKIIPRHLQEKQELSSPNSQNSFGYTVVTTGSSKDVEKRNLRPLCENVLQNVTQGTWRRKIDFLSKEQREEKQKLIQLEIDIEDELQDFWIKRGIQMGFWRPDHKCGYENYEIAPPLPKWPKVGSWCNARSERPCCSNRYNGTCMPASSQNCDCLGCVDLRSYIHADVSDWIVDDSSCKWINYSSAEICDVIESSPFDELHFVGDSFMRNMFRTFLMMVTGDPVGGAWCRSMEKEVMQKCTRMQQFFWKECRQNVLNIDDLIFRHKLCGGRGYANFKAHMEPYYGPKFGSDFVSLVKSKLGHPGTLIILSLGFHVACDSKLGIESFLGPAVQAIEDYYAGPPRRIRSDRLSGRWPQIILALPLRVGLLKPTKFLVIQNDYKCAAYCREMAEYGDKHDIRVLDFRKLTTLVHSFDGTHHGMNVNIIKNQILLNFIASIRRE